MTFNHYKYQYPKLWCLLCLISFLGINTAVLAQDPLAAYSNFISKLVVAPSPDAASLGKYGNTDINYYTGSMNLSIPLHTIGGKEISVPIGLSYDGSGNRVEQIPSIVGLGWALNAGGVITRSAKGNPDKNFNYFSKASSINSTTLSDPFAEKVHMEAIASGSIETQPDEYFFNFAGFTGKFYISPYGDVKMRKQQDLVITPSITDDVNGFVIKDSRGNKYYFTLAETTNLILDDATENIPPISRNFNYKSSWYLTLIESANATEKIELTYTTETTPYIAPVNVKLYETKTYKQDQDNTPLQDFVSNGSVNTNRVLNRRFIESIAYKQGDILIQSVDFETVTSTKPFATLELKKVKIYNQVHGTSGGLGTRAAVNQFELLYDGSTNRLTLKSVQELPTAPNSTDVKNPHTFVYNSTALPVPTSNSIDNWGYYNAAGNASSLIAGFIKADGTPDGRYPGGGANRETDPSAVQAGVMTRINYPTGGYTLFEYEAHKVTGLYTNSPTTENHVGGLRLKSTKNYEASGITPLTSKTYNYLKSGSPTTSGILNTPFSNSSTGSYNKFETDCPLSPTLEQLKQCAASSYGTVTLYPNNNAPLGADDGAHISYSRVEEVLAGSGKTVYNYDGEDLIKKEVHSENANGTFNLLSETVYEYTSDNRNSSIASYFSKPKAAQTNLNIYGIGANGTEFYSRSNYISRHLYTVPPYTPYQNKDTFKAQLERKGFTIQSLWKQTSKITVKEYFLNPTTNTYSDIVTTETTMVFDNKNITQATQTTVKNSDNMTHKVRTYFPHDVQADGTIAPAHPSVAAMITNNMIGIPLRTEMLINGTVFNAQEMVYGSFPTNQLLPQFIRKRLKDNSWQTQFTVNSYNANGLPTQTTGKGFSVSTYYDWTRDFLNSKKYGLSGPLSLTWNYTYDLTKKLVETITNENGVKTHYRYDDFLRLKVISNLLDATGNPTSAKAKTTMDYQYVSGTNTHNFIKNTQWFEGESNGGLNGNMFQTIQYFDGLGRSTQTVREKYTYSGQNQKTYMTYDNFGRPDRNYQAIESSTNTFETIDKTLARSAKPYTNPAYESSPWGRVEKQFNEDGSDVKMAYGSNTATDAVKMFNVDASNNVTVSPYSPYLLNQLYKNTVTDENGNQTQVFKDKLGRVILTRKIAENNELVDTYNVYDSYGDLVMVIPPAAMDYTTNALNANLVFKYKYDKQGRLCEKTIPGAAVQKFYYNNKDQMILTQDGNMRKVITVAAHIPPAPQYNGAADKHLATRYDDLGRVVETGWMYVTPALNPVDDATLTVSIAAANSLSQISYKPNKSLIHQTRYRTIGYKKPGDVEWIDTYTYNYDQWARPVQTVGMTLNGQYDMSYSELQASGWALFKAHQFTGPDNQSRSTFNYTWHDHGMRLLNTQHQIALDNSWQNRTPLHYTSWQGYDHLDRLSFKRMGGAWAPANGDYRFSQNVNYHYNNRSWLTQINTGDLSAPPGGSGKKEYPLFSTGNIAQMNNYSVNNVYSDPPVQSNWGDSNPDLFTEIIRYSDPNTDIGNVPVQKNGNISQIEWQVAGREKQAFSYTYDKLNRLTEAKYADIHTGNWGPNGNGWPSQIDQNNRFNETMTYDKRGNIQSLVRKGVLLQDNNFYYGLMASSFGTIDNLTYNYTTDKNRVSSISDAADGTKGFKHNNSASVYGYDDNGNLISDTQKGISNIEYNYLNLPIKISFTGNRSISFIYDATGRKWRKTVNNNGAETTRDYIGDAEYLNGQQDIIHFTEGYAQRDVTTDTDVNWKGWVYKYTLKDHLGNTRVTYCDKNKDGLVTTADIEQINHYYAFGMNMEGPWAGAIGAFKYQYNGKELNSDFGLDWNDYGARNYDPATGRWTSIDPLAEAYNRWSPYNYTKGNPIRFIDPDGMRVSLNDEARMKNGIDVGAEKKA
jgi:RHS repeat-associated protein